jgi:hypothetical protein
MTRRKKEALNDVLLVVTAARRFEQHHDPLDAWRAISWALTNNLPMPPAARDYLLGVARKIVELEPMPGHGDRDVAEALGLHARQGGSLFERAKRTVHDLLLANEVWRRDRTMPPNASIRRTFMTVAEEHSEHCTVCTKRLTYKGVEKAWSNHHREIIPPHLRDQFPNLTTAQLLKATRSR